jgi:hypothetical protein
MLLFPIFGLLFISRLIMPNANSSIPSYSIAIIPTVIFFALIIIIGELNFWLVDNAKPPKNKSTAEFTIYRKAIDLMEALYVISFIAGIVWIIELAYKYLVPFITTNSNSIIWILTYSSTAIVIIAIYIYLNSLKYKKNK